MPFPKQLALYGWIVGACLVFSGCATTSYGPSAKNTAAVARGEALAARACGACHGLGAAGESHFPGAPPFRDMRFDYSAARYERRMAELHGGHVGMPPAELTLDELSDIGAYIRSVEGRARP